MANKRYNLAVPIKYESRGEEKTFWHSVGSAWIDEEKDRINITLNSAPYPVEPGGQARLIGFPPKNDENERSGRSSSRSRKPASSKTRDGDVDDEIPF